MADNANPVIHAVTKDARRRDLFEAEAGGVDDFSWLAGPGAGSSSGSEDDEEELIDAQEVFDLIRSIHDPEHPLSLEQLAVVSPEQITVTYGARPHINVEFTPTISHCSLASLIGLSLRVRLLRALPDRFKVDIRIRKGTHESENSLNKQLNDKERVAAALENQHLLDVVQQCLAYAHLRGATAPEVVE